jgi:hypothetical protein
VTDLRDRGSSRSTCPGTVAPIRPRTGGAGAIALYLASTCGGRWAAVRALEGGLGNPGRFAEWTNRADVDHSGFLTS